MKSREERLMEISGGQGVGTAEFNSAVKIDNFLMDMAELAHTTCIERALESKNIKDVPKQSPNHKTQEPDSP